MADESSHIAAANRNQEAINHLCLDYTKHSAWVATIAFYKALHVVEAVFFRDPGIEHTSDHGERYQCLKKIRRYEHVFRNYAPLSRASNVARYLEDKVAGQVSSFDAYLSPDAVLNLLLFDHLKQVENSARKWLSNPGDLVSVDAAKPFVERASKAAGGGTSTA